MPELSSRNLRIVESILLSEYHANTKLLTQIGNAAFAEKISSSSGKYLVPKARFESLISAPYVLYHSWLPGFVQLSKRVAEAFSKLDRAHEKDGWLDVFPPAIQAHIETLGWLSDGEPDLDALVDKVMKTFVAIQNPIELKELLELVKEKKPGVVVEIGTARGGVLYSLAQLAHPEADLISIDLPGAPNCGGQTENERKLFATFAAPRQEIHFIPQNSHWHTTREALDGVLDGKKVDLLFIDGDHSYGGVACDFWMYKNFLAKDGLLVFHDTRLVPDVWGPGNEVGLFWKEIEKKYKTREILDPKGISTRERPRGVKWAWGIGVVLPNQEI